MNLSSAELFLSCGDKLWRIKANIFFKAKRNEKGKKKMLHNLFCAVRRVSFEIVFIF